MGSGNRQLGDGASQVGETVERREKRARAIIINKHYHGNAHVCTVVASQFSGSNAATTAAATDRKGGAAEKSALTPNRPYSLATTVVGCLLLAR